MREKFVGVSFCGLNRGLVLAVFIGMGVVPTVPATGLTCWAMSPNPPRPVGSLGG